MTADLDADVVIIGFGPVGQTLSILLAQAGYRVCALERWPEPYPRPRAVHFDHEIARVFASLGLAEDIVSITEPADDYEWRNQDGETLLRFDWSGLGPSGWPIANMFSQPILEAALARRALDFSDLTVKRGLEAVGLHEDGDRVEVVASDASGTESVFRSAFVVGCDGANSFVRKQISTDLVDLGFFYDWLIVDVVPHQQREWKPINLQMCDPRRPTTVVSGGPGRRRWEFMRLPGETADELNREETAWRLLEPWHLTPANADLERHTIYTFQARWADRWRRAAV